MDELFCFNFLIDSFLRIGLPMLLAFFFCCCCHWAHSYNSSVRHCAAIPNTRSSPMIWQTQFIRNQFVCRLKQHHLPSSLMYAFRGAGIWPRVCLCMFGFVIFSLSACEWVTLQNKDRKMRWGIRKRKKKNVTAVISSRVKWWILFYLLRFYAN